MKTQTNSSKFIKAFNEIDYALRCQHNFKRSMGFSDMIRRAVPLNHIVRKYEDELIDYGRLRNAIIHSSKGDQIIAEPHDDVTGNIISLAKIITAPPKAIDILAEKEVFTVNYDVKLRDVICKISSTRYSNIPVYKNGELIGIANGQKLLDELGNVLINKQDLEKFLNKTTIEQIVTKPTANPYFIVLKSDVSCDEVLREFLNNRKLLVIILTKTGTMNEPPLAIITSSDYMELNKALENY